MALLILKGFVTGLILSIMLGPSFFMLIETSIQKGIRAAVSFDFGVLISDIIYILIAYLFFQEISGLLNGSNIFLLKIVGGIIFVSFGSLTLKKKTPTNSDQQIICYSVKNSREYWMLFIKGFLLNFANPMIILYWLSVITIGIQKQERFIGIDPILIYLLIILITFFSIDIIKIFAAKKLRPFVTPQLLHNLNRFISFILIGFGTLLFFQGIVYFIKL